MIAPRKKNEDDEPDRESYGTISGVAREIARNLDALVWAVNPRHDALDKRVLYIVDYVTKYLSRASIQCDLDVPEELPVTPLSSELRHNILLVIKEALHKCGGTLRRH